MQESVGGEHAPVAAGAPRGYNHAWWTIPNSKAYLALGARVQFIYVGPAAQTVVVKVSYMPLASRESDETESIAFLRAAAQWKP